MVSLSSLPSLSSSSISYSSSSSRFSLARLVCVLLACTTSIAATANENAQAAPSLRSRFLAANDPDHDGSIVKLHEIEHAKFHGRRVMETVGVGLHVWVAYRNPDGQAHVQGNLTSIGYELDSYKTVAGVLPSMDHLLNMLDDGNIDWIAEDSILKAAVSETEPYGVQFVSQNGYRPNQSVAQGSSASCSDPNVFKVGIIDSGMSVFHPDLICNNVGTAQSNCLGASFGLDSSLSWYNPVAYHGTHVSGIIAARKNGNGVVGLIPDDNLCILTARVLDDHDFGLFSNIMAGVNWAADNGAKVINLSLVGGTYLPAINQAFEDFYQNRNILVFAAAGNDGSSNYAYPASYPSVISVGAVDINKQHTWFSQRNSMVDLVGPGQDILSTLPLGVGNVIATLSVGNGQGFSGMYAQASPQTNIQGTLIHCADGYTCNGPGRHICLMPSGGSPQACQMSGGVAVVIYNTNAERLTDYSYSGASLTVMMVSNADGQILAGSYIGQYGQVVANDGYGFMFGTSMATPHVAGAAASVWRACPNCGNDQVAACLTATAMDLGSYGKDTLYGSGMVQGKSAYQCLQRSGCC
ncbi:hypothetical protein MPSEU_000873600 [Mayamaea pseudoterrestris]|nr:hypothetical protein MPSEU_000873600 [Mayamaea pseudoterrestris]